MSDRTVTCPECQARLEGRLVPADQDWLCRFWSEEDQVGKPQLVRGLQVSVIAKWRQELADVLDRPTGKVAIWKVGNAGHIGTGGGWLDGHARVYNSDNSRTSAVKLCELPEGIISITGTTAEEQIAEDRPKLLELRLEAERKAREKAEAEAREERLQRRLDSVLRRLDDAGLACGRSSGFPRLSGQGRSVNLGVDAAEWLADQLEQLERLQSMARFVPVDEAQAELMTRYRDGAEQRLRALGLGLPSTEWEVSPTSPVALAQNGGYVAVWCWVSDESLKEGSGEDAA